MFTLLATLQSLILHTEITTLLSDQIQNKGRLRVFEREGPNIADEKDPPGVNILFLFSLCKKTKEFIPKVRRRKYILLIN